MCHVWVFPFVSGVCACVCWGTWGMLAERPAAAHFSLNFKGRCGATKTGRSYGWGQHSVQFSQTNTSSPRRPCCVFPPLPAERRRKWIGKALSYLPPHRPAAASGWWGWCGVPPRWLKLFSWHISPPHKQWGWMQEPVDPVCPQRQQPRAFRDTCAQNRAQLSCLTSCPCWQWQILTTGRYSWKPFQQKRMIARDREKCSLCDSWKCAYSCSHVSKYCAGNADKVTKQILSAISI